MKTIGFQDVLQTETDPQSVLGAVHQTPDGRQWVYGKANEAVSQGNVAVPVSVTGEDTVSSSTDIDGDEVYVTQGSAGWTTGQFADAWLLVDDGTGQGQVAKIRTNDADTLTLYKEWALTTSLSSSDSDITIYRPHLVEKAAVTDKTQRAIGGAQVDFSQNDYGWFLHNGPGVVIAGEALTEGGSAVCGDDTEGQVVKGTTGKGDFDEQTVGICVAANSTADKGALLNYTLGTA